MDVVGFLLVFKAWALEGTKFSIELFSAWALLSELFSEFSDKQVGITAKHNPYGYSVSIDISVTY